MAEATAAVEAAEHLAAAAPSEVSAITRAWIIARRGRLLVAQNRGGEALGFYERALDMATASEGSLSKVAIFLHEQLAWQLFNMGRTAQAQKHVDAAISALRTLGGAHEMHAALQAAQFAFMSSDKGFTYIERLRVLEENRAILASTQLPIPDWFVPQVDFWIGAVKARQGNLEEAVPMLEQSAGVLWGALPNTLDHLGLAAILGDVMSAAGKHDAAANWFAKQVEARRQFGESEHPWAVMDYVALATNLMMSGRFDAAQAVIDGTPHFKPFQSADSTTKDYDIYLVLASADIQNARGNAAAAVAMLEKLGAKAPNDTSGAKAGYDETYGRALCRVGRNSEGLNLLKPLEAEEAREGVLPQAPWRASRAAVIGLCALGAGDRKMAVAYAAEARAAFTTQPGVSPYYKASLARLERALGLKLPPV
jgi:tetratricopeptide (TPR) repeat protein